MEFSYSQTENFEMEKLSSDTGYFKKTVEINRGTGSLELGGHGGKQLLEKLKCQNILEITISLGPSMTILNPN